MIKPVYPLQILRNLHKISVEDIAAALELNPGTYLQCLEKCEYPMLSQIQLRVLADNFDMETSQLQFLCKEPNIKKLSGRWHRFSVRTLLRLIRKFN